VSRTISTGDLEAYLDESLPVGEMSRIEKLLRNDAALRAQLAAIHARRDEGVHTLGEIWRQHRLSCLSREQLGGYVLGTLDGQAREYVLFHLETLGCRFCQANLEDLKQVQREPADTTSSRRRKYFQSSVGGLKRPTR
jgi:hypothetical protein